MSTNKEFTGPQGGNLEDIAVAHSVARDGLCLRVDDDNQKNAAIMLFKQFDLTKVLGKDAVEQENSADKK